MESMQKPFFQNQFPIGEWQAACVLQTGHEQEQLGMTWKLTCSDGQEGCRPHLPANVRHLASLKKGLAGILE